MKIKIGQGYDVHRLVENRPLIVGGVNIPYNKGLDGHSDADVLLHAVCDALLGASGLDDIGVHYPDTDDKFKGISSLELLKSTVQKVKDRGFEIGNIDATVLAQAPKFSPFRDLMRKNIAQIVEIPEQDVNIKFTTTEKLGFVGKGEGMAAMCVVLLESLA